MIARAVVESVVVEFAVLGPLEVRCDGEPLRLRRGRPRALLIALLLRVGRSVPADVLIDEVWGAEPPADAGNALQVLVSYLRRSLRLPATGPAPALRTMAGGYELDVEADQIDVYRFERAVSSAVQQLADPTVEQAELALEELQSTLALWRGPALQDVAYEAFVGAEVDRLSELRAVALEFEVEAMLRLGRHDEAIPALRQLVVDHPLRERFPAQLIVALYRAGRQADALRAFDATRRHLIDELGVEPGIELQRLHRAVLDHDSGLDWTPLVETAAIDAAGAHRHWSPMSRLPASTSSLIGREREIASIGSVLADNRIVTLTGPGGSGKTRLALAVARAEAARTPVWLVELAQIGDPAVVPSEIARVFDVATHADPTDAVSVRLGDRAGLLVLDTCEHLIDACATTVYRLLQACPNLSVLATSRQALAIVGEVAWPVPPLAVPAAGASIGEVLDAEAVRLFDERSRAVRPDFRLDASNAAVVGQICAILDGLPLAIELAAARMQVLSAAAILERLDDRFAVLSRVGRAADVRQQSLRATIEWSYDLLGPEQRIFFERLGVFASRFSLDAAAEVGAHDVAGDRSSC